MIAPPTAKSEIFVDTNVLVYLVGTDTPKAERSERILEEGVTISVQVLNEFTLTTRRKSRRSWDEIRVMLNGIRPSCFIVPVTLAVHERGLLYAERYNLNVYDANIIAAAALAGCTMLYSEDMHDGLVIDGVTIRNPYAG
jgi:predicted nucleic acid-binding protein